MAFVSVSASASATLLISVPSTGRAGAGACAFTQPRRTLLAPLHAAKGAKSVPVEVVMESKVKGKKKKGSGAGNLPGALDVEIREAQEYLNSDEQMLSCGASRTGAGRAARGNNRGPQVARRDLRQEACSRMH